MGIDFDWYLLHVFFLIFVISSFSGVRVGDSIQPPDLYDFDHVHFGSSSGSTVAILYGALGTDCFKQFHVTLVKAAQEVHPLCSNGLFNIMLIIFIAFIIIKVTFLSYNHEGRSQFDPRTEFACLFATLLG